LDAPSSPKRKRALTQEEFERLLAWLDPDREAAGQKHEKIRTALINRFRRLNCADPEVRADETIDRVGQTLPKVIQKYKGDREPYFYAVAYYIYLEYLDRPVPEPLPETDLLDGATPSPLESLEEGEDEAQNKVLDGFLRHCMARLDEDDRHLVVEYYRGEKQEKIRRRIDLADERGVDLPYLRVLVRRIRVKLKKCILNCLGAETQARGSSPYTRVKQGRP
jgi:hypothetical protein